MAGITLTPDIYTCGVNLGGGRTDLEIAYREKGQDAYIRKNDWDFRNQWIGHTKAARDAISPLVNISNISVPSFHSYLKSEPGLRQEHSTRLHRQLKRAHKEFEFYLEKPKRGVAPEIERYLRVEAFLAKHL